MSRPQLSSILILLLLLTLQSAVAQTAAPAEFPGLDQWNAAITSANFASLQQLYAAGARSIGQNGQPQDISLEKQFWQDFLSQKHQDVKVLVRGTKEQNGLEAANLTVSFKTDTPAGQRTRYVLVQQAWQQQGDDWRIVAAMHTDVLKMPQPSTLNPNLYPKGVNAREEIKDAVERAGREHKRVILVFGANWCDDCHVLDFALHTSDVAPVAEKNFIVVHVDIGEGKLNSDLVREYKIPLDKGVPALAVLGSDGKLLYSQQDGEVEAARSMDPDDLIAFLNKWKP
jgi:thiol-disulfide isomerase/thioredoxin